MPPKVIAGRGRGRRGRAPPVVPVPVPVIVRAPASTAAAVRNLPAPMEASAGLGLNAPPGPVFGAPLAVPVRPDAQPTPPPLVPLLTPLTVSVRPPESSPPTSSDLSPASSDISSVSTSTSTTPTPSSSLPARKGRKRKSGISGDEAAAGLASGQYKLKPPPKSWTAPCWSTFQLVVVDDPTEAETGNVQCQRCFMCFAFDSNNTTGSSSLTKHARAGCRVPQADSTRSVLVPARMKNMLFEKLAEKCARDLSSLHSAVGPGMTGVVQAALDIGSACPGARAADIMPTANTVRRHLTDMADEARAEVVVRLREAISRHVRLAIRDDRCSATTDMWTDEYKNFHYISITCHFVNSLFESESWGLCTPKFPCTQKTTGVNIREALEQEMAALGIPYEEFCKIEWVTDQGANVVKALEGLSREDCLAHCINTVLKTSLTLSYVELRQKIAESAEAEEMLSKFSEAATAVKKCRETQNRKVGGRVNLKSLQKAVSLPKKSSFMYGDTVSSILIHQKKVVTVLRFLERHDLADFIADVTDNAQDLLNILKLLDKTGSVAGADLSKLRDGLKVVDGDSELLSSLKGLLAPEQQLCSLLEQIKTCKDVVKFLKTASYSTQLPHMVKQECETRWNSLFTMLDSLMKVFEQVRTLLTAHGEESRLSGIVVSDMEWLVQFLSTFKVQTDKLQGENYPTLPFAVLATRKLQDHCLPVLTDTPLQAILRARVGRAVTRKLKPSMTQKIATFLWPQYRHLLMLSDAERDEVYATVRQLLAAEAEEQNVDGDLSPEGSPKRACIDAGYEEWTAPPDSLTLRMDEVDQYLMTGSPVQSEKLLEYWKAQFDAPSGLRKLAKLAQRTLGKPATSAPSERVFSAAGFLIQERRTRLAADMVDKTIFLHAYLVQKEKKL
ncbi:Transposable element Hobo transposase [Frankliniella fusca]|uniref:Transposable element Hobo transposase n=1 Tax=Frankliniella fusca TaxID=407009 RepID=A0AAE1LM93_9NEOP|nr:Transposable element Hobo transposase [Frankliniella fusca]